MVLHGLAYFEILGLPLMMYLGILTLLCLVFTAAVSVMNRRGVHSIPMKWHFIMARVTIALAVIHGALAMLSYF